MSWYVKVEREDGTVGAILCDTPNEVAANYRCLTEIRVRNRPKRRLWTEDLGGRHLSPFEFGIDRPEG